MNILRLHELKIQDAASRAYLDELQKMACEVEAMKKRLNTLHNQICLADRLGILAEDVPLYEEEERKAQAQSNYRYYESANDTGCDWFTSSQISEANRLLPDAKSAYNRLMDPLLANLRRKRAIKNRELEVQEELQAEAHAEKIRRIEGSTVELRRQIVQREIERLGNVGKNG